MSESASAPALAAPGGLAPPEASPVDRAFRRRRMRAALIVTLAVLVLEVVGGLMTGSLALLADAAHMFTDVAALTLAWAGMALGDRAPTRRHTFGLARAEVLAAFVNAQLLLVAGGGILWEAWRRFRSPEPVETGLMLVIAAVGLAANLVAVALLRSGRRESLNMRAAYLEVVTDALGSVAVLVGAFVMARTGWWGADAVVSAGIALLVLPRAIAILREAAHILMEGAPADIDVTRLRAEILAVPGVEAVHDLHFWTLTSGQHSASVHICADAASASDEVLQGVQRVLQEGAGVDHATVQVERAADADCGSAARHA
jgi:cobalt-zinc-cadmium efflux system protein